MNCIPARVGMLVATTGFFVTALCFGWQKTPSQSDTTQLLSQLRSDQPTERIQAYEQLRADPAMLSNKKVQEALLDLLGRENQLRESFGRAAQRKSPSSDEYGEGFANYVGELGETVDSFADWSDPRQVCIFVHESYDIESQFAAKIAQNARVAVPCLLELYRSDVPAIRFKAAPVLVQVLAKTGNQLDPVTAASVRKTVIAALHDSNEIVRSYAVRALGMFGGQDLIPALEQVAQNDRAFNKASGGFWIRQYAARAIAEIQKRVAHE